jgi:hypothetical protein
MLLDLGRMRQSLDASVLRLELELVLNVATLIQPRIFIIPQHTNQAVLNLGAL